MRRLNYLTITRPDISFPVSVVSQFLQSPYDSHRDAVIRVLHYIKGIPGQGCYMKTEVTPKLLDIVMEIGQARLQTYAPLQDIVYLF